LVKRGLIKAILTLNWPVVASGDTTSQIYRIRAYTVKKRTKKKIAKMTSIVERFVAFLGGVLTVIYTLWELFFK
jgi:hypothetical protein